jgi:fatty-acyl-CoA synthase
MHAVDLFDHGARNFPDRVAFSGAGGDISYAQAQAASNRIARALLANGIGTGTRMAVLSPNNTTAMPALLGALRAGCAWCNVNLRAGLESNVDVLKRGHC